MIAVQSQREQEMPVIFIGHITCSISWMYYYTRRVDQFFLVYSIAQKMSSSAAAELLSCSLCFLLG